MNATYSLAAASLLLAACSDSPQGGPADLSTPEATAKQAANIVSVLSNLGTIAPSASRKFSSESKSGVCDSGSQNETVLENQNVDSPYTTSPFTIAQGSFVNCRLNKDLDGGGSNNDYVETNGDISGGQIQENNTTVTYTRVGADSVSPLNLSVRLEGSSFSQEFSYGINLLSHSRSASSSENLEELFSNIGGSLKQSLFDFGFSVKIGQSEASGERFSISNASDGQRITGSYDIRIDDFPGASSTDFNCAGSAGVVTTIPLLKGNSNLFDSGEIELSSSGTTASVRFNSDNTATVTAADGANTTVSQSSLVSDSEACSGLLLRGLAFANL